MATTQAPIVMPQGVLVKRNGNGSQPVWVKLEFVLGGVPGRLASHRTELIGGVVEPVELIQYNADPLRQWSDLLLPSGNKVSLPNNKIRFHDNQDEARAARGILERVKAEIRAQELRPIQQEQAYHNHNGGQRSRAIAARGRPR
ncbi:hypothetical protein HYW67_03485 [Candidatus Parcubacteria bacterium]|nr:hypothetical protein [Candidatus Parcubacteria bacterium]